ncbi:glutathione S-transferase family protein [Phenylobacterium sp.]|jgi:glutathione S-transferase|uniref:glutathione S-transferase family protein n=1 Tax=Phenylobacterium sp. TaxID=1871053 RepID=UPI002F95ABCC
MSGLRILGRTSSINVRKVLWTAAELGLAFEHEPEWAGERSPRTPEFLALNPNGQVPVILDGDRVLWESNTICRYLVGKAGRTDLLPSEPFARAEVEMWMDWQASELNPAWGGAFLALVRKVPAAMADPAAIARSAEAWNQRMLLLEDRLARTGAYVAGEAFTLADIPLGLSLQRWLLTPIDRPPTPALAAWRARLQGRPAARAAVDPTIP